MTDDGEKRRPGAWPTGAQRPTPAEPLPASAWTAALEEYRALSPKEQQQPGVCECEDCRRAEPAIPEYARKHTA